MIHDPGTCKIKTEKIVRDIENICGAEPSNFNIDNNNNNNKTIFESRNMA